MILVTGGTGFVGSHLLYQLSKEYDKIKAIYRSGKKLAKVKAVFNLYEENFLDLFNKIEWVKADITDVTSLESVFTDEISHVYHCAALVTFNPSLYLKMRKVNIEGTANLVNFCIDNNISRFCHVSSIATLGNVENKEVISESNEWDSNNRDNSYAITKYGAEMEVWRASQEGLDVVIVNPGVILGSGFFDEGSGTLFSKIYKGFKFYTEGITGFVGVKDVAKAMILLMKTDIKNEMFILTSENMSFKDVFFNIADNLNVKRPFIEIGKLSLNFFWRIEALRNKITGKEPLITKSSAKASLNKEFFSSEKIKKAVDYAFEPISKVIKKTATDFLKSNYSLSEANHSA